ncbi:MAG TPA: hypothetical protein VFT50_01280 [Baekduia sp.]|nr:hypothetical protein [Baekduia sp.]
MPQLIPATRSLGRRAVAVAVLGVALAAPAIAHADGEQLTVRVATDPVAGLLSSVNYEYDTAGVPLNLTVVERAADGPACQPTVNMDEALVGALGSTYLTPSPVLLNGHAAGQLPYTFPAPGNRRVCAWLYRTPDDTAVATSATASVRAPQATLAVTGVAIQPRAHGADIRVQATGSIEAPNDLLVTAVPATRACPATYDEDTGPRGFDVVPAGTATRVSGGFDLTFTSHTKFRFGQWRVCGYLQDGGLADAASASASSTVDLVRKPRALRRPRIRKLGRTLSCDGGRWRGKPAPALAYRWYVGAKAVRGASRHLAVSGKVKGQLVRCRVTASNAAGKASATSKPFRAR